MEKFLVLSSKFCHARTNWQEVRRIVRPTAFHWFCLIIQIWRRNFYCMFNRNCNRSWYPLSHQNFQELLFPGIYFPGWDSWYSSQSFTCTSKLPAGAWKGGGGVKVVECCVYPPPDLHTSDSNHCFLWATETCKGHTVLPTKSWSRGGSVGSSGLSWCLLVRSASSCWRSDIWDKALSPNGNNSIFILHTAQNIDTWILTYG